MPKKICVRCSAENEEHYRFCKNCGASLPVVDRFQQSDYEYKQSFDDKGQQGASSANFDYGSVNGKEIEAYVGAGKEKICRKFFSMELLGKKTSWHFPVFLLGILFGFFGLSFWFFSRKMFKVGVILAAFGVAFMMFDAYINLEANRAFWGEYQTIFGAVLESGQGQEFSPISQQFEAAINRYAANYNPIMSQISNYIGSLFLPFIMGVFGLNIYKNKAIKDIKNLKEKYPSDGYLLARIAAKGGRKIYLALIPVVIIVVCTIISMGLIII